MNSVKDTISKSSRQISSQMSRDMNETRQTLMLLRDDIGIAIPRELARVVASSAAARTAIMAMSDAFIGLAFINLGVEAFQKIEGLLEKSSKQAAEEAKHTSEIADFAMQAVDATIRRQHELSLIGLGQDAYHEKEKRYLDEEIQKTQTLIKTKQAEVAAQIELLQAQVAPLSGAEKEGADYVAQSEGVDFSGVGGGMSDDATKRIEANTEAQRKKIVELQAALDELQKQLKTNALAYADYEANLDLTRVKNWQEAEESRVAANKDAIEQMYQAGEIGLAQELMGLRTAATERHNIEQQALQDEIDILQQDPSRNVQKIEELNNQKLISDQNYDKELTDIRVKGIALRKAEFDAELKHEQDGLKAVADMLKSQALPNSLFAGIGAGPLPGTNFSLGAYKQNAISNATSDLKDGAASSQIYITMCTRSVKRSASPGYRAGSCARNYRRRSALLRRSFLPE